MKEEKFKIGLLSLHSFLRPGGVKNHVLALQEEYKKQGLNSKIVVPKRKTQENYGEDILFLGNSFPFNFNGTQSDLTVCFNILAINEFLKKEQFDVLHFHNFGVHSWQILDKSKAINVLTFHSCVDFEKNQFFKKFPFLLDVFKKTINKKMHGIIGVAPFNLDLFCDFKGPKAVIPNGIKIERFVGQNKIKKYNDGKINILFLGRIEERKGLIYLLYAFKELKNKFNDLRLIVVGKGNMEAVCKEWIKTNKVKDVIFEGEIEGDKIPLYYATCDIFCSPAIFGESFGIVLLEAMASSKPVVAFANKGYKTVLVGKGKDFLAEPSDWRGLAQKIEILIKDEGKRKEMAEWGREEAKKYDWAKIAKRILDFYKLAVDFKKEKSAR